MRFCNLNEAYTNSYENTEEIEEKQTHIYQLPETQTHKCSHCDYFIEKNNKDNIIIVLIIILLIVILMK